MMNETETKRQDEQQEDSKKVIIWVFEEHEEQ